MKKLIKPCDITAIIITYNEEKHISRCIDSLKHGVKKIFVLDSFSKDGTLKKFNLNKKNLKIMQINLIQLFKWQKLKLNGF